MTNQNTRDSFIFYRSFYESINHLPEDQQLQIYKAISSYSLDFKDVKLEGIPNAIFTLIKPQLEANRKRYLNGIKEKKKSKTEAKQKQNKSKVEANVNVNDNVECRINNENKELINKQFEQFYNLYGKKKSPSDVKNKLKTALKKDSFDNIMLGLDSYIKNRSKDSQFWKYPATWLNQECWKDEYNQPESNREQHTADLINKMMNDALINKIEVTRSNKAKLFMTKDNFYKYNSFSNDFKEKILNSLKKELGVNGLEYNF